MYGLVNKAVQQFVIEGHGEEAWDIIRKSAGVADESFISMEPYPDKTTYDLVAAAAEHLEIDSGDILEAFGGYWIRFSMEEGYGDLLNMAGNNFPAFLKNLNNLHTHVAQSYTKLRPPSFLCEEIDEKTFRLVYSSERPGLTRFVGGLLLGLAEKFNVDITIDYKGRVGDSPNDYTYIVEYKPK
ncbi:MAG: heme NO-binding domain-containing protein [Flavobacteriales bacterium]|nr:heme NO-binding domain-containing protein [Flavobacteriales bacterium]